MSRQLTVLFAGGGTAGHLLPALATEEALKELAISQPGFELTTCYLATRGGAERKILAEKGAIFRLVPKTDFPRRINRDLLTFLPRLVIAVARSLPMARQANVVVGFGGYVALPAYCAAWLTRKPLVIHEANALAGMANRLGRRFASRSLANFPLPGWDSRDVIGLPIRRSIWQLAKLSDQKREEARVAARISFGLEPTRKTILIFGGSLGAARLNAALESGLTELLARGFQILHASGEGKPHPPARPGYHPISYIKEMEQAYLAADVVVARSGAGTCAEISAVGVPALLVPLNIGNGEQRLNGERLLTRPNVRMVENDSLDGASLIRAVEELATMAITPDQGRMSAAQRLAMIIIEEAGK